MAAPTMLCRAAFKLHWFPLHLCQSVCKRLPVTSCWLVVLCWHDTRVLLDRANGLVVGFVSVANLLRASAQPLSCLQIYSNLPGLI